MALLLVVDDQPILAEQYAYDLKRVGGHDVLVATGGHDALDTVAREAVDCLILDLEMPDVDGFDVLRSLREQEIDVPVIVYTGAGSYDRCVQAVRLGAYGFIDKAEPMERVAQEVANALDHARLTAEIETLRREVDAETPLLGDSPAMQMLRDRIGRLAAIPSGVLILGESGTGKELVARELHRLGPRAEQPFVAVNCAALPEHLVESELFGHERGAFTGAHRAHKGAFQQAAGGTLFLDEVGELPLQAQAKLLRVLEQRELTRVGGERTFKVDARVLAATNRDLDAEIEAGRFRADLYFRLNVHVLQVPPLRDRAADVAALAEHFLAHTCRRFGIRRKRLAPEALDALLHYDWARNNVRELRNIVERLIIASDTDVIQRTDVPAEIRGTAPPADEGPRTFQERRADAERRIILTALARNDGHVTQTADDLGLADHASLLKIMRRLNLKRP